VKIVQGDQQPIVEAAVNIRNTVTGNTVTGRQHLLAGDEGTPGQYVFRIFHQKGEFETPRHRHTFDQWRYQFSGEVNFDRVGTMKPGWVGYFPEGAYYGPQTSKETNVSVLVQFGGPSGLGYMSGDEDAAAQEQLKAFGRFEGGVFHRNEGVEGRRATDAHQATWEFVNKRPMPEPQPQYIDPFLMDGNAYRWMPLDGTPGVEEKSFGMFTDCKIRSASYKLDPGATFRATGRGIFLVLAGRGTLEDGPYRALTAVYLNTGESATFTAAETSEILLFGLPEVARMRRASEALAGAGLAR
jgi:hypothetical protein